MTTTPRVEPAWTVLVPVKRLDRAKSRLSARPAGVRRDLSLAFALDTVRAALACSLVDLVAVVTDDEDAAAACGELGARTVAEPEAVGLNGALAAAAARPDLRAPATPVAALVGDLPALRPAELALALEAAARHPRSLVGDAAGTGTTLLTALASVPLDPRFGPRSRAAHVLSGAVELGLGGVPGLRRDVDSEVDLWDAGRLGLGPATAAALDHAPR